MNTTKSIYECYDDLMQDLQVKMAFRNDLTHDKSIFNQILSTRNEIRDFMRTKQPSLKGSTKIMIENFTPLLQTLNDSDLILPSNFNYFLDIHQKNVKALSSFCKLHKKSESINGENIVSVFHSVFSRIRDFEWDQGYVQKKNMQNVRLSRPLNEIALPNGKIAYL